MRIDFVQSHNIADLLYRIADKIRDSKVYPELQGTYRLAKILEDEADFIRLTDSIR